MSTDNTSDEAASDAPTPVEVPITSDPSTSPVEAPSETAKPATKKLLTKRELLIALITDSGLTKRQVESVLDGLRAALVKELKTNAIVTVPGLLKLRVITKPARPERRSINPATRQPMTIPAKPARKSLKSFPLKVFKDDVI